MDEKYVLHFSWDTKDGKPHDQVMLLAYTTEENTLHQKIIGAFRKDGADILALDQQYEAMDYRTCTQTN